ncbi:MAG: CoA-binding protein [Chitinophagales bacterium]|nr:MAG: CoA-binding protein [Chitinophagales bacterium]
MKKKTLVIGASPHPSRYAYLAVSRLAASGHAVIALGNKPGFIGNIPIETERKPFTDVHTVTLYIHPSIQKTYYNYILEVIRPKRIIFNPGTENQELKEMASKRNIEVLEACTLVLLSTAQY